MYIYFLRKSFCCLFGHNIADKVKNNKSIIGAPSTCLLPWQMSNSRHLLKPKELRPVSPSLHLRYPWIFELRLPSSELLSHRSDAIVHNRRLIRWLSILAYLNIIPILICALNTLWFEMGHRIKMLRFSIAINPLRRIENPSWFFLLIKRPLLPFYSSLFQLLIFPQENL